MVFEHIVQAMADRMKMAASIGMAIGHARMQKDYVTAAALLSILESLPLQGADSADAGARASVSWARQG
jgi:hypothetical protein